MRRLVLAFAACCLAAFAARAQTAAGAAPQSQRELPQVGVREQAGAPLRLSATAKRATPNPDGRMFEVYFVVENADGGPPEVEEALRKPFDAAEEN